MVEFDKLDMNAFQSIENIEPEIVNDEIEDTATDADTSDDSNPAEDSNPEIVGDGAVESDEDSPSDEDPSQPNLYSSLAQALQEEGVLPSLTADKKIKSVEDLIEAVKEEIKANEYNDLTPEQKAYLEAIRTGISPEQAVQERSVLENLKTITQSEISENEELRKQLLYQDFILKGYSPEKADKLTQRSIDIGEDISDATDALQSIIEVHEKQLESKILAAKEAKLQQDKKAQEDLKKFKSYLETTKEFIPGVKVNQKVAEEVFKQAVQPVGKLDNGMTVNAVQKARLENPIEFEAKLNYLFYITKGFSDFGKIAVSQKSKAVKELDDFVKGNTFVPKGSDMGNNYDFTPKELQGGFSIDMINNIKK